MTTKTLLRCTAIILTIALIGFIVKGATVAVPYVLDAVGAALE